MDRGRNQQRPRSKSDLDSSRCDCEFVAFKEFPFTPFRSGQLFILQCIHCPSQASVGELWELVTEGFFPVHSGCEKMDLKVFALRNEEEKKMQPKVKL